MVYMCPDSGSKKPCRQPEVFMTPLQVYDIAGDARHVADCLHWGTTLYWVLDLPLSFLTAVYINDVLHTSFADVARAYLKSWFFFDALMLVPEVVVFVNNFSPMEGADDAAASGFVTCLASQAPDEGRSLRSDSEISEGSACAEEAELLQAV